VRFCLFYLFLTITNLSLRSKHVSRHLFCSEILLNLFTVIVQSIVSAVPLHIVKSTSPLQSIVLTSTLHIRRANIFFCRREVSGSDERKAMEVFNRFPVQLCSSLFLQRCLSYDFTMHLVLQTLLSYIYHLFPEPRPSPITDTCSGRTGASVRAQFLLP
jgi:hypothetical protein